MNFNANDVKDNVVVHSEEEFKKRAIVHAISELMNAHIVQNEKDANDLYELYLKDGRRMDVILNDIRKLQPEDVLRKLNRSSNIQAPQEVKITLENVAEFQNKEETKNFIKIHYPYPSDEVKIVENYSGKTAKELFEESKDEEGLVSVNGFVNSVDVYKQSIQPEKNEVKLHNVTDLARRGEFMKLTPKERECVIGLVSSIVNQLAKNDEDKKRLREMPVDELILKLSKNVFIAPEENIVVLCVPNDPTKDEIKAVTKNDKGEYKLQDLKISDETKTYDGEAPVEGKGLNSDEDQVDREQEFGPAKRKKPSWEKKKMAA